MFNLTIDKMKAFELILFSISVIAAGQEKFTLEYGFIAVSCVVAILIIEVNKQLNKEDKR